MSMSKLLYIKASPRGAASRSAALAGAYLEALRRKRPDLVVNTLDLAQERLGKIVLVTLLAEAPQAVNERNYQALRSLTGVAPVTKRSGKSCHVEMRQACSHRLRNAVYHWARVATQQDHLSRYRYAALRARGHSHGRALRTVADRLLGIACVMLKTRTLFDPSKAPAAA